jgi:hypothetical protein
MGAQGDAAFRRGLDALCWCSTDEEAVRLQRVFDEHGGVLDHRAKV